jgi:hypothetical protein
MNEKSIQRHGMNPTRWPSSLSDPGLLRPVPPPATGPAHESGGHGACEVRTSTVLACGAARGVAGDEPVTVVRREGEHP